MSTNKSRIKSKASYLQTKLVKNEKPSDSAFQGKKDPNNRAIIDAKQINRIEKTIDTTAKDLKDFRVFVKVLKDIEPFWITHYLFYYNDFQELLKLVGHTALQFRKKYGNEIPQMPDDLFSMPNWIVEIEAAIKKLEIQESNSRKKKVV